MVSLKLLKNSVSGACLTHPSVPDLLQMLMYPSLFKYFIMIIYFYDVGLAKVQLYLSKALTLTTDICKASTGIYFPTTAPQATLALMLNEIPGTYVSVCVVTVRHTALQCPCARSPGRKWARTHSFWSGNGILPEIFNLGNFSFVSFIRENLVLSSSTL